MSARIRRLARSPIAVVTGVAIVAAAAIIFGLGMNQPSPSTRIVPPTTNYPASLVDGETLGDAAAPLTLDVWSDFQCPYCASFSHSYLPRLVADFVIGGQLRIVAHDIALVGRGDPDESRDAAVAAGCAADQGQYWTFHDTLFLNQDGENRGGFSPARLEAMAATIDLDQARWLDCRSDPRRATDVDQKTASALSSGIDSTPTLVINGVATPGLPPTYEVLAAAIRAQLQEPAGSAGAPASNVSISP